MGYLVIESEPVVGQTTCGNCPDPIPPTPPSGLLFDSNYLIGQVGDSTLTISGGGTTVTAEPTTASQQVALINNPATHGTLALDFSPTGNGAVIVASPNSEATALQDITNIIRQTGDRTGVHTLAALAQQLTTNPDSGFVFVAYTVEDAASPTILGQAAITNFGDTELSMTVNADGSLTVSQDGTEIISLAAGTVARGGSDVWYPGAFLASPNQTAMIDSTNSTWPGA